MRLFLDANILFSAAYRNSNPALLLFEFAIAGRCNLLTSAFAWDEAHRNITLKCPHRTAILDALRDQLDDAPVPAAAAIENAAQQGLPDKDAPILAAALVADVDILVTGDRTHFGHLYGKTVEGLQVLTLKATLARLLEDP
ncbi:MAG: PIN domain-containing protein [Chromatiaceae bacterium]|nr:PIN domain-containing protein [Chromatiaceae bacterium]